VLANDAPLEEKPGQKRRRIKAQSQIPVQNTNLRQIATCRQEHAADFKLDVVSKHQPRIVWVHKDEKTLRNSNMLQGPFG
jgi:hypothetical protein